MVSTSLFRISRSNSLSRLRFFNRLEFELIWNHRQMLDAPWQFFAVRALGIFNSTKCPTAEVMIAASFSK